MRTYWQGEGTKGQGLLAETVEVKLAILEAHSGVATATFVFLESIHFTSVHQLPDSWSHLLKILNLWTKTV